LLAKLHKRLTHACFVSVAQHLGVKKSIFAGRKCLPLLCYRLEEAPLALNNNHAQ